VSIKIQVQIQISLPVICQWSVFSPSTPASSTTKSGRHDIAEILLKVALNTNKSIKSIYLRKKGKIVITLDTFELNYEKYL
jgi:hypothetical protein